MSNHPGANGARTSDVPIMFYAPPDLKAQAERMAKLDDPRGSLSSYLRSLIVADVRKRTGEAEAVHPAAEPSAN